MEPTSANPAESEPRATPTNGTPPPPVPPAAIKATPVMTQYLRLKQEAGDAILFFRMGDFYEMFFEDAVEAADLLGLTLTSRDKSAPDPVPMAGVPWHSANGYITRLLRAGRRVAICEQIERPGARGLMDREIVEILTPGTAISESAIEGTGNVFLAALATGGDSWGLAALDVSTGETLLGEWPPEIALGELERLGARELLFDRESRPPLVAAFLRDHPEIFSSGIDAWHFSTRRGMDLLREQFGEASLEAYEIADCLAGLAAAGALITYARQQRRSPLPHLRPPQALRSEKGLFLDEATLRNLEVLAPVAGTGRHCLFATLDATLTPMGSRALRRALARPSADVAAIEERLAAVAFLVEDSAHREALRAGLRGIPDLERALARISCARGRSRDLGQLRDGLVKAPVIAQALEGAAGGARFPAAEAMQRLAQLGDELARALEETGRLALEEGSIRSGYDARLDELRAACGDFDAWVAAFQERERASTGIPSLRVGHNKVFGYYIEVTRAHLKKVPPRYQRKQTLVGGERYVVDELREWETRGTAAQEEGRAREVEILEKLRALVVERSADLQALAHSLALWDLIAAFAQRAVEYRYTRPEVNEGDRIEIRGGRHPVVERFLEAEGFVANDIDIDSRARQIQILTGPNMAGKSTYLRQIGLIVLMAQAGSFVPADVARIGVADRIFTRVGASDNIARGQSTFLVEMIETSRILHAATSRSLVLLDEIGRGTSTYDGLAIAWAVAEDLRDHALRRPRTLFATHFHELTVLPQRRAGYVNLNILVKEWKDRVIFVRRVVPGAADRSYGIQVARLAGLPESVLLRAKEILTELEEHGPDRLIADEGEGAAQMGLFGTAGAKAQAAERGQAEAEERGTSRPSGAGPADSSLGGSGIAAGEASERARRMVRALSKVDVDRITGVEALAWLEEWQRRVSPRDDGAEAREENDRT